MDRIVFVSLFLGLVSGTQWVDMRADPEIKTIRITLGGREVAALHNPPWHTAVDFGSSLEPKELVATGFDDHHQPVARASQLLNLPRPVAELELVIHRDQSSASSVNLVYRHREHSPPKRANLTLDGKKLKLDGNYSARLPQLNPEQPHVVAAEMHFKDGMVARAEQVIRGGFSDDVGTQLTAIAVPKEAPESCFTLDGKSVRTTAAEAEDAFLVIVKEPDPREARKTFSETDRAFKRLLPLRADTSVLFLWPVAGEIREQGEPKTQLFARSNRRASAGGMAWMLTLGMGKHRDDADLQFADAVAVGGVRAVRSAKRRAVVLVLSDEEDKSHYKPADVRHYLAEIGVPLFVWSMKGPRPELADSWGTVDDISTIENLGVAVEKLRKTLDEQRIVWVSSDPLRALRISRRCGGTQ